jgi:predicted dehydrogenase/threonine dehydrogenase-like Zn-dependent dehydrogenase
MKQIAQNYRSGTLALVDAPLPACKSGGVLVRTEYSVVSSGTEMMKIEESKLSLLAKARARPDQVKKVVESVAQQGAFQTVRKVLNRLDSLTPLGYSLAGTVVEVGGDVREFTIGQRVACGGNLFALHAEYNWIPTNLCVAVPDSVKSEHAAFTTVGAVAMQGFRQSEARLGETACIIGLGLIGQLLTQILNAAGIHVFGIDVDESRCRLAEEQGAAAAVSPQPSAIAALLQRIAQQTGRGADHVFLAAGGASNHPLELAVQIARDRGRLIDIGKCRLDLPWNAFYEKELDLRFSRSYGPGRYDPRYEEDGIDYPVGYVRWTERRNMQCFIELLAAGKIDMGPLVSDVVPFLDSPRVYEEMSQGSRRGIGIVFRYPEEASPVRRDRTDLASPTRPLPRPDGPLRIGMIGCGNYARSVIVPALRDRRDVLLVEVATTRSLSAVDAQAKFGFARASTDVAGLLGDPGIDAVMIMTRHASHAILVCEALRAGKAVFVEKPLAITAAQLAAIVETVRETGNDRLMVGFNRRFAPLLTELKAAWGRRAGPCTLNYTINAGPVDAGSWYAQTETEGSRFVGEGCHFIDTASWWLDSAPCDVFASRTAEDPDNITATLIYPDSSVAHIAYLTGGDRRYPKELVEVFGSGKVARFANFARAEFWQDGERRVRRSFSGVDKGQKNEVAAFLDAIRRGAPMPIPLHSILATTAASFAVLRSVATRRLEPVAEFLARGDVAQVPPSSDAAQ